jgi:hypothetical protein
MRHLVLWMPLPCNLTGQNIIISHVIGGVKSLFHSAARTGIREDRLRVLLRIAEHDEGVAFNELLKPWTCKSIS